MKTQDEARIYQEIQNDLVVPDPLGGETQADKELREASAKWRESKAALSEIVTRDWDKMAVPVAAEKTPRKRARARG